MSGKQQLDPKYDNYDYPTISATNQSGHPGHTTPQQDAQVHQLRTQLEQAGFRDRLDTLTLVELPGEILFQAERRRADRELLQLRFLRARKFDVNLAKQM